MMPNKSMAKDLVLKPSMFTDLAFECYGPEVKPDLTGAEDLNVSLKTMTEHEAKDAEGEAVIPSTPDNSSRGRRNDFHGLRCISAIRPSSWRGWTAIDDNNAIPLSDPSFFAGGNPGGNKYSPHEITTADTRMTGVSPIASSFRSSGNSSGNSLTPLEPDYIFGQKRCIPQTMPKFHRKTRMRRNVLMNPTAILIRTGLSPMPRRTIFDTPMQRGVSHPGRTPHVASATVETYNLRRLMASHLQTPTPSCRQKYETNEDIFKEKGFRDIFDFMKWCKLPFSAEGHQQASVYLRQIKNGDIGMADCGLMAEEEDEVPFYMRSPQRLNFTTPNMRYNTPRRYESPIKPLPLIETAKINPESAQYSFAAALGSVDLGISSFSFNSVDTPLPGPDNSDFDRQSLSPPGDHKNVTPPHGTKRGFNEANIYDQPEQTEEEDTTDEEYQSADEEMGDDDDGDNETEEVEPTGDRQMNYADLYSRSFDDEGMDMDDLMDGDYTPADEE